MDAAFQDSLSEGFMEHILCAWRVLAFVRCDAKSPKSF